jgi:hypothetical protein
MFPRSHKTSRFGNRSDDRERRGFDAEGLPTGDEYFSAIFGPVRFKNNGWALVRCCFHLPDRQCSRPETPSEPLLPIGTGERHTWLHSNCWGPWRERRRTEAIAMLARRRSSHDLCGRGI